MKVSIIKTIGPRSKSFVVARMSRTVVKFRLGKDFIKKKAWLCSDFLLGSLSTGMSGGWDGQSFLQEHTTSLVLSVVN